jgi:hypothetical protein
MRQVNLRTELQSLSIVQIQIALQYLHVDGSHTINNSDKESILSMIFLTLLASEIFSERDQSSWTAASLQDGMDLYAISEVMLSRVLSALH